MELRVGKNHLGNDLHDLYDDNGKFVMETTTVEGIAKGKSFLGIVVGNNQQTLKIISGSVRQLIELNDITKLIRIRGVE